MSSINIRYFALLREEAGVDEENITVPCKTYGELYQYLKSRHNFSLPIEMIQVAADDEFTFMHKEISEAQTIVFIPPVAGG